MNLKQPLLLATFALALTASAASAQVAIRIGPPPPVREVVPPPPPEHRDWAWHNGYHRWDGRAYVWVPGRYEQPPYAHAHWVEGHWAHRGGSWVWIEGHWRR